MVKEQLVAISMFLIITGMTLTTLANANGDAVNNVRLSLYTKCGCMDGASLPGVKVTGQDASGAPFDVTTDINGYASIEGSPGNWQFTASKEGYVTNPWTMPVTESDTKYPFLLNDNTAWISKADSAEILSNEELARLVTGVFPEGDVPGKSGESIRATAYAVAKAESSGKPTNWGDVGLGDSLGLWQINLCWHPNYKGHELELFGPEYNAKAALEISSGGTKWTDWSTWNDESYRQYMVEARNELNKLSGIKPTVTLTLYVHEGNPNGPYIPDATVTVTDGSGNSFQQTTDSNGYVTIEGDSGTWSFSASADGYETNNWDQDITETDTKDASLQREQQPSESSVVGKWAIHGETTECKTTSNDHDEIVTNLADDPNSTWDSVIDFYNDGSLTVSYLEDGVTKTSTGEWVQYGDTIRLQYNPEPMYEPTCLDCSEDYVIESWQTEGDSEEATINGDTMSATGSSIWHDRSYSKQYPEDVYYSDVYCSYRWSASRANI